MALWRALGSGFEGLARPVSASNAPQRATEDCKMHDGGCIISR